LPVPLSNVRPNVDPDEQDSDEEENPDEVTYQDFYLPPQTRPRKHKRPRVQDPQPEEHDLDPSSLSLRFQKDLFADTTTPNLVAPTVSSHAKRQAALRAEASLLEEENIANKAWMYVGEASAKSRPKNSLLEIAEQIDVERSTKPVPIVTEERTRSLEEVIKRRVVDNLFDDVVRKLPRAITHTKSGEDDPDVLDPGQKPSRSLAEIYEQSHLRRLDPDHNPSPLAVSTQAQHSEIDLLWKTLSHQLDSLVSWRFVPAPDTQESRVVSNLPAVDMEDARPDAENAGSLAAPQEVYRPRARRGEVVLGGVPVARVEMSREERARTRKRTGRKREGTDRKGEKVEGGRRDVIDTLKKGGVKIIASGKGRTKGRPSV
jgi:U3 small nucleolar RNA-associated protein MPP10